MNDLRAAIRSLLSSPWSTAVVVVTLALAIGANVAIFGVVRGVLLEPMGYEGEDRLAVLWAQRDASGELFRLSPADYRDVRDGVGSFGGEVALYRSIGSTLDALEPPVRVGSLSVTPELFSLLRARPVLGDLFRQDPAEIPRNGVVLTHSAWQERFAGDPELVGQSISVDGEPRVVLGVTEEGFRFPPGNREVELFFPMLLSDAVLLDRDHRMFDAVARLSGTSTLDAANAELDALARNLAIEFPDSNTGWSLAARSVREEMLGSLTTTLWLLWGAVLMVLLVACANIVSILVARSTAAAREYAMRSAMGAGRIDLLRRSLLESLVLGAVGGGLGVALAAAGVRLFRAVLPAEIPRREFIALDPPALLLAGGLTLGAVVLFGLVPALQAMRPDLTDLVKSGRAGGGGTGAPRLRETLVVVQVAVAVILVVCALLLLRSFSELSGTDPGFREEGAVAVALQLPGSRYEREQWPAVFEELAERMSALPGVTAVGAVSDLPMSDLGLGFELEYAVPGIGSEPSADRHDADMRLVLPGYFDAMGIELVAGRRLEATDRGRERATAVVNRTLVRRAFGDVDPIGRMLELELAGEAEVVGVVEDLRHRDLQSRARSEIFLLYGRPATAEMQLVAHTEGSEAETLGSMVDVIRRFDAQLVPSRTAVLGDLLWRSVGQERFTVSLILLLALCAAVLAAVGIYGIVAYSVALRTAEIGVRMALGAGAAATMATTVRRATMAVAVGLGVGLSAAAWMSRLLQDLLVGVSPLDPVSYLATAALVVVGGAVAALGPSLRATRIDPVHALREG